MKARHLSLAPPDAHKPCDCGHTYTWHATDDGKCTYEIVDTTNTAWMRCACDRWRA